MAHRVRAGSHRSLGLAAIMLVGTLLAPPLASAHHGGGALSRAVRSAAAHGNRHDRGASYRVAVAKEVRSWAYGDVVMIPRARKHDEGGGVPATFLARREGGRWHVALQGTSAFLRDLHKAPGSLIPMLVRKLDLAGENSPVKRGGSGPSAEPQFSLPWAAGETWQLWYGPHNTDNDYGPHPYTSLDFSGGDGIVRAAASGVVYRPCSNLVVIDHGGGWETGYYHMPSIFVHSGEYVHTGDRLGTIGTATGCGGVAYGRHVHFSIYHFASSGVYNVFQTPSADMNLDVIGDYVVHDGSRSGLGYMQSLSTGRIVWPSDTQGNGDIYNSGVAGGGKTVVPAGYVTLANVSIMSGPGTSYPVVGSLPNGSAVTITCQTKGSSVNGSSIWDKIGPGQYIADWYVSTPEVGQFTPGIPLCSSSGSGGTSSGGTLTPPPNGVGTASSTSALPSWDNGAHDTSFENQIPWSSLNGNTNQQFACGTGTAYNGNCYLNVSASVSGASFIQDIPVSPTTGQCYTLTAWLRARSGGPNVSGTLALWAMNGRQDEAASTPFTASSGWQRFLVTLHVPTPTDSTPWNKFRGQVYLSTTGAVLNWDLTQWYGPYNC